MNWAELDIKDRRILRRLIDYHCYKVIAAELQIGIGGIGNRIARLRKRYGCKDTTTLLQMARDAMNVKT